MARLLWVLVRTAPAWALLFAVLWSRSVRRSLWTARRRRDTPLLMLDDRRVRHAAFDALDRDGVRSEVLVRLERTGRRHPFVTRQITHALADRDRRADLRQALDRPDVRTAVRRAVAGGAGQHRLTGGDLRAIIKIVWTAAGLRWRDFLR
jgi:hypothetical protein